MVKLSNQSWATTGIYLDLFVCFIFCRLLKRYQSLCSALVVLRFLVFHSRHLVLKRLELTVDLFSFIYCYFPLGYPIWQWLCLVTWSDNLWFGFIFGSLMIFDQLLMSQLSEIGVNIGWYACSYLELPSECVTVFRYNLYFYHTRQRSMSYSVDCRYFRKFHTFRSLESKYDVYFRPTSSNSFPYLLNSAGSVPFNSQFVHFCFLHILLLRMNQSTIGGLKTFLGNHVSFLHSLWMAPWIPKNVAHMFTLNLGVNCREWKQLKQKKGLRKSNREHWTISGGKTLSQLYWSCDDSSFLLPITENVLALKQSHVNRRNL